jgi:hypothetical protein
MTEQKRSAVLVESADHYFHSAEAEELKIVMGMNVYFVAEKGRGEMLYQRVVHSPLEEWMSLDVG